MKTTWLATFLLLLTTGIAQAAPISDGSIFKETFTNFPESPLSNTVGAGATVFGGAAHIETTTGTEGVFRVNQIPAGYPAEYVVEYDWTMNGPSGDNFYMFYAQQNVSPYFSAVALRTIEEYPSPGKWTFQVDTGSAPFYALSNPLDYGQTYHITLHVNSGPTKPVDVFVDGSLLGTFDSRNPQLTTDLVQWGDPSSGQGHGNATLDNISIGLPTPEPSTIAIAATAITGLIAASRRRTRS
jgi:hypothetical protein